MKNRIFVCHEFYTPSHYTALEYLAREHGYEVIYCEPNLYRELRNSFRHPVSRTRLLHNFLCTLLLLFTKGSKVVVGMAPYNPFLKWLLFILRGHELYYHSSYSCWDGSRFAHKGSDKDKQLWREFTNSKIKHFFAVSQKTKEEVVKNGFCSPERISVVNHSYNIDINEDNLCEFSPSFICVGRLSEQKGIKQLLDIFSKLPQAKITFVGNGELESLVKGYESQYNNIRYAGFVNGLTNLIPIYKKHAFLVLNSIKTSTWEELFGMALYEGMACGCVPLANNHPGPKEIITNGIDGYLCDETHIGELVEKAMELKQKEYYALRTNAIKRGQSFHSSIISHKWDDIFKLN
jgi:glycosyltransferase involved in cell wall biosynthesis